MFVPKSQDQGTIVFAQQDFLPLTVESFLIDRKAQGPSAETLSFYQKKLKYCLSSCEAQAITQILQITPDLIRRFIPQMAETHNQSGVPACFGPLRTLLLWAESEERPRVELTPATRAGGAEKEPGKARHALVFGPTSQYTVVRVISPTHSLRNAGLMCA